MATDKTIIAEGETCMEVATADQGAFVIGGAEYYRVFRKAVIGAERSVRILGWDFHSQVDLVKTDDGYPKKLGEFLVSVLKEKPELEIHILIWNFSIIYANEREWTDLFGWKGSHDDRLYFRTDDEVPVSASHHQKMVVVDGKLGFAGGIDLAAWRWDEVDHFAEDERRVDPWGKSYGPYHDLQMAVTGEAAEVMSRIFFDRWKRATGETLEDRVSEGNVAWPDGMEIDFRGMEVGFSRTYSEYEDYSAIHEIEELHLRIILEAERYLYIENQYLSSHRIGHALCERLREKDGPEIVIVIPAWIDTWKEESTLGLIRDRLIELLRKADEHGRLRVLYPRALKEDGEEVLVYVHAKLIICDDRIVKIGSANLTNRSMRVDSELDLVIAELEEDSFAKKLLHRLLGIHHHLEPEKVEGAAAVNQGLIGLIDGLKDEEGQSLIPVPDSELNDLKRKVADSKLLDPEEPLDPGQWLRAQTPDALAAATKKRIFVIIGGILGLILMTVIYQKFLGQYVDKEAAMARFAMIRDSPWSPAILTVVFLVASVTGVSLNVLLVAAALVLNPWLALATGVIGAHMGANIAFFAGKFWGRGLVDRFGGERLDALSRKLGSSGVVTVALLRLIPIAPFPVVNVVAGSSHLGGRVFNFGSFLGMAPGMLAVVLLADFTKNAVTEPNLGNVILLVSSIVVFVAAAIYARRSIRRRRKGAEQS